MRQGDKRVILSEALLDLKGKARGRKVDYVAIQEITRANSEKNKKLPHRPDVLSANALVINNEGTKICLHIRSMKSSTYPGALHIIGGAFDPTLDVIDNNTGDLRRTAIREVLEETRNYVKLDGCKTILQREIDTNFTMITFLGATTEFREDESIKGLWEGSPIWFALENAADLMSEKSLIDLLPRSLLSQIAQDAELMPLLSSKKIEWVPSGKQAFLAWLNEGTPMTGGRSAMPRHKSDEILDKCLSFM